MEDDPDGEWRFELDEVDENGIVQTEVEPVKPESVELENALFVAVGAFGTLLVVLSATL